LQRLGANNDRCSLILTLLLVCASLTYAQPNAQPGVENSQISLHQWGAVTLFHGLPSDHVRAIAQDSDGIMWFGTDSGLAKFDGRRVQRVAAQGPAATRVRSVKIAGDGVMWIGTDTGALRLINGELKPVPQTEGYSISSILAVSRDRILMTSLQGTVFDCSAASDGSFAIRTFSRENHYLLAIESSREASREAVRQPLELTSLVSNGDNIVVGTHSRGLLGIDLQREPASAVSEVTMHPRPFFVDAIERDQRGRLWFGAQTKRDDGGLYLAEDPEHPKRILAAGAITSLAFDNRGDLWAGSDSQGVYRCRDGSVLEHFTFENTAGGLRSNHIYSIFVDREGVIWFGTDRGACRYDSGGPHVETLAAESPANFVRSLFASSDGRIWCGTSKGLFVQQGSTGTWAPVAELRNQTVHAIVEEPKGRMLVGTASGFYLGPSGLHGGARNRSQSSASFVRESEKPSDSVRSICSFKGSIYVATFGGGLQRLEGSGLAHVWPEGSADPRKTQTLSLYNDGDRRLLIGTGEAGVFAFDGSQVTVAHAFDALVGSAVWNIGRSGDSALLFATAKGVYIFKEGKLDAIAEGVDVRQAISIPGTPTMIWCATSGSGLLKVLLRSGSDAPISSRIDAEQGLPSPSVFAVLSTSYGDSDSLLIGTSRGLVRYQPSSVPPNLTINRVMGKRAYSPDEIKSGLRLEYPQNGLSIDVSATSSRSFPEQFQYEFSLFNLAGKPVKQVLSRDPQLLIEGLRPGSYRVAARAFSNDLLASDTMTLEFTVARAPFPWTSTALALLLSIALAALWWGARQNRRLEGTNRQLAKTRLELATETERERRRIARDLHDQTLADLRRLMLTTDRLPAAESNGHQPVDPAQLRSEIETISTEIRRICEDLSPSALANVGLAAALEWALSDAVGHLPPEDQFAFEFRCTEGFDHKLALNAGEQIQIYRIVQEAISNICRHAKASRVTLTATITHDGELVIQIEDDGRGFDANGRASRNGRGLNNIRSRASLIDGEVTWSQPSQGGTIFRLRRSHASSANLEHR
jgi:signal transduction histidine kinase/ligand-binding sensor domain-containing protein